MTTLEDMTGIEVLERIIHTSIKEVREEIACKFGKELAILSPDAKIKMRNIEKPTKLDRESNSKYWQAYQACK